MDCSKCAKDSVHCGMGMGYKGTNMDCPSFEGKSKPLYSEPLPYDIDDVVYYMEKVSEVGGHPGFKLTKYYVHGYYNFGNGVLEIIEDYKRPKVTVYSLEEVLPVIKKVR